MFTENQFSEFLSGYITAMLWSSGGETPEGEDLESLEDFDLSDEARQQCEKECREFLEQNASDLAEYAEKTETSEYTGFDNAGHDFWLTRAGHGVGFWDRGFGELGDRLTEACKVAGERWPYVGDDGKVYL